MAEGPSARDTSVAQNASEQSRLLTREEKGETRDDDDSEADPWEDHDSAWRYVQDTAMDDITFFEKLHLAKDGGLAEVHKARDPLQDKLWYNGRYFSALLSVAFVFMNIYFIFAVDLAVLSVNRDPTVTTAAPTTVAPTATTAASSAGEAQTGQYLLTRFILLQVQPILQSFTGYQITFTPTQVICAVELVLFSILLARSLWRLSQVMCTKFLEMICGCVAQERILKWSNARWFATSHFFFELIPTVQVFSAMKLLFYITPQVLSVHLNELLFYQEGTVLEKMLGLVWFIISRVGCAVIGFDSFLVKYRTTSIFILSGDLSLDNVLGAVVLLNQILGVVQVSWIVKERLFRFIFAGPDGVMQNEEQIRLDTWNALIAQKIWEEYPNLFKRFSLLLTFNDDDFQRLCFQEEGGEQTEQAAEMRGMSAP